MRGVRSVCVVAIVVATALVAIDRSVADTTPTLSISNTTITEGDSGTRTVRLVVGLSHTSRSTVTVQYSTVAGSAQSSTPSDFRARSGSITIKPGKVAKYVALSLTPDTTIEGDENFGVALSSPVNATLGDATASVTIRDDDPGSGLRLSIGDITVQEGSIGSRAIKVTVDLSVPAPSTFLVQALSADGTATHITSPHSPPIGDYAAINKTIAVRPGARFVTFVSTILPDLLDEGDETFTVSFTTTAGTIDDGTGVITIRDEATDNCSWIRQVAKTIDDPSRRPKVVVDGDGNSFVAFVTDELPTGAEIPYQLKDEVYLAKYGPDGTRAWIRHVGSDGDDILTALQIDASGDVVVVGTAAGTMAESDDPGLGGDDIFIATFDTNGDLVWLRQVGTSNDDVADSLGVDIANDQIVIGGRENYALAIGSPVAARFAADGTMLSYHVQGSTPTIDFVRIEFAGTDGAGPLYRFDSAGNLITTTLIGLVTKYDPDGNVLWSSQIPGDYPIPAQLDIGADDHILYSGSIILGATHAGLIVEIDDTGVQLWTRYLEPAAPASTGDMAAVIGGHFTDTGEVRIAGTSRGWLTDAPEAQLGDVSTFDMLAAAFDGDGNLQWTHRLGSPRDDFASATAIDPGGNIVAVGRTAGTLPGSTTPSSHNWEWFVTRFAA